MTNNHAVESATSANVRFIDGTVAAAEVVGRNPAEDQALLKVDPSAVAANSWKTAGGPSENSNSLRTPSRPRVSALRAWGR